MLSPFRNAKSPVARGSKSHGALTRMSSPRMHASGNSPTCSCELARATLSQPLGVLLSAET
eukprot:scaffold513_cov22-Tisochrysis_lutea.AAC.2